MIRLAIVTTHPIQYYAPWFRHIAETTSVDLRVFYLWDFGVAGRTDPTFGVKVTWDVPLLEGYEHEFVPNLSRYPGTQNFRGIDNPILPARLTAFGPDAVLCLGYNFATIVRLLRVWDRRRSPLLLRGDSHRLIPPTGPKGWVKRHLLRQVFRRFAGCLYVGQANREYYRIHGVPDDKLFFCPHSVDNDRFTAARPQAEVDAVEWKRSLGIPNGRRVVLFAGKFEPKKRPLDLLEAFRRAAVADTALLFVGNGELEGQLRQGAAGLTNVFFAPFQNQSTMPRTYAVADLFVLPSFGLSETWGLAVNESMCLGRPAVVSSHVGCGPDLIESGTNGAIFPAGDIDALAGCLRAAQADPATVGRWGRAAAERVKDYSYRQATDGLLACLDRVVPSRGPVAVPEASGV